MTAKLNRLQLSLLRQLADGRKFGPRCNYMLCDRADQKWIYVWADNRQTFPQKTFDALCLRGLYAAGAVTEAGRLALAQSEVGE